MQEQGLKDFDSYAWFGMVAPKGTPQAIVERLNKEMVRALTDPGLEQTHDRDRHGADARCRAPSSRKFIAAEVAKWRQGDPHRGATIPKVDQ